MLPGVVKVQVHLAGIGVGELADLEVDDHQAPEAAVEEQQIDAEPLVADAQAPLAADEGKVVSDSAVSLEVRDERFLQIVLGILVLEIEELQDERVSNCLLGREGIAVLGPRH